MARVFPFLRPGFGRLAVTAKGVDPLTRPFATAGAEADVAALKLGR